MLSVTAVTQDRLYKANTHGSAPSLPFLPNPNPLSAKQAMKTQKLLSDLNAEFLNNAQAARRHSIETKLQTESFMNSTAPKITLYQHQTDSYRKTLASLEQRINTMCSETISSIKRKRTDIDLGQTVLTNKVKTEFENITDGVSKQVKRTDWINGITQTKTAETASSVSELKQKSDETAINAEKLFENMRGKLKTLRPKLTNADSKMQEMESTVQSLLAQYREFQRMMEQLKNANKMIKYLRDEGVQNMVSDHYSKLVQHISDTTIAFDKKMSEDEMFAASAEEKTKMQQSEIISTNEQLDQISKTLQDNESRMNSYEGNSNENIQFVVNRLDQVVGQIREDIAARRKEIHHRKWLKQRVVKRQIQQISNSAQLNIDRFNADWTEFTTNNENIQKEVEKHINSINKQAGGQLDQISARVDLAAAKIAWCQKRFLQWARVGGADNNVSIQKIVEAEKNLAKLETSLNKLDKQKATTPKYTPVPLNPVYIDGPCPLPGTGGENVAITMPNKRLTYDQDDMSAPLLEAEPEHFEEEEFVDNEENQNLFSFLRKSNEQFDPVPYTNPPEEKPKPKKQEEKPKPKLKELIQDKVEEKPKPRARPLSAEQEQPRRPKEEPRKRPMSAEQEPIPKPAPRKEEQPPKKEEPKKVEQPPKKEEPKKVEQPPKKEEPKKVEQPPKKEEPKKEEPKKEEPEEYDDDVEEESPEAAQTGKSQPDHPRKRHARRRRRKKVHHHHNPTNPQ